MISPDIDNWGDGCELRTVPDGIEENPQAADPLRRQQAALLAFSRRATGKSPVSTLMQDGVGLISEILEADLNGIAQPDADGQTLRVRVTTTGVTGGASGTVSSDAALDPATSLAAYVFQAGGPVVVSDFRQEHRFSDKTLQLLGVTSGLAVPLRLNGKVEGVLSVYSRRSGAFTVDDACFAETIAHMLISSVGRLRAEEEVEQVRKVADQATRELKRLQTRLEPPPFGREPGSDASEYDDDWVPDDEANDDRTVDDPRPFQRLGSRKIVELRASPRRAYQYKQAIAPMYGGCIPARKEFFDVVCQDISAGGIAFYVNRRPDFDNLVVALGRAPGESFFTAEVAHVEPVERNGKKEFLVGCRFAGRLQI